jgi:hypothetical protein
MQKCKFKISRKEEHILRMSEIKVLRTILEDKKKKVTGDKLHNDNLQNFYSSSITVRMFIHKRLRWTEHVTHTGQMG